MHPDYATWKYREPTPPTPEELGAIEITQEGRHLFDKLSRENRRKAVEYMRTLEATHAD